jgi:hypothetical protein
MVEGVPHPLAAPVTVNESGVSEDLQVVRDGALALADGFDELAYADFAFWGGCQHREESETDRITERVEACGQLGCLGAVEGSGQERGAALDVAFHVDDSSPSGHSNLPLTIVDASVIINVSTSVDVIGGFPCLVSSLP